MFVETQRHNVTSDPRLLDSIDYFLVEISGKVQVGKTKREKAEGHYEAIGNVLKESPVNTLLHQLDVKMKPFGGFGTNTAVHPYLQDEFDLDLIVQFLTTSSRFGTAERLFNEVFNRLHSLDKYKHMVQKKDRCIRLNYAGDFHLDLMPATLYLPYEDLSSKIWVPEEQDDGSYKFILVDPIGLNKWFESRCELERRQNIVLNERDFEMMPLTTEEARKPKLKQAVQLIKRARDKYFYNDSECKKILKSVVILTVAGNCYEGETNLYALVKKVLFNLDLQTRNIASARVENPVHNEENFLESLKYKPRRYEKLRAFLEDMRRLWDSMLAPNADLNHVQKSLKAIFGESVTDAVLNEYGTRMDAENRNGRMRMATGGAIVTSSTVGSKVGRHQFFGDS